MRNWSPTISTPLEAIFSPPLFFVSPRWSKNERGEETSNKREVKTRRLKVSGGEHQRGAFLRNYAIIRDHLMAFGIAILKQ